MKATDERLCVIALTALKGVGDVLARHLLLFFGSAVNVFNARKSALLKAPGIGPATAEQLWVSKAEALQRAEKELEFVEKKKIRLYSYLDEDYPRRLKECQDAPVVFYWKGEADLNAPKILSIVGTRKYTDYGRKLTEELLKDLAALFPEILIVSGLAYGIDVCAHRNALRNHLPTVAVLAHGLDRIYPSAHRNVASELLKRGGVLSDFMSGDDPVRENFLRRNRIIAGLADATVVVESAERGGSLVTADIAFSYGRDVFAFPGRTTDERSVGCNRLIQMNKAALINNAADLVKALCWDVDLAPTKQQMLKFPDKPDSPVIKLLKEKGEFHINQLAIEMDLPVHKLTSMLFELELEGHIRALPGGIYTL
jgi:DNA processing protein